MKAGTLAYLALLVAAAGGLVYSAMHAGPAERRDGRRVYRFACWGAAEEMRELRSRVIDPINASAEDYRIHVVSIPSDYNTKLSTMIAGGTPPDLFYLSQEQVAAFADQGALLDLTDLAAAHPDGPADLSGYYPSVLEQYVRKGRLYGLPWIAQPVILYCNRELFRDAGIALPDGSWDWDRFVAAGRKLTRDVDGDGRIDRWGFIVNGWPPVQMWIWQNGGNLFDPQTGELRLADPRVVEACDAYAGLIHDAGIAPPLSVVSESGFSEMFRAGKVAMFMGGAADNLDRVEGLDVVTAEPPAGPAGRATFAWSAGLHISPSVDDPQRTFAVYRRLLDAIQRWKIPAPRRDLAARLEEFEPRKAASADVIRASMEYMRPPASFPRRTEFETLFHEEFEGPLLRTGAPARALAERALPVLERLR